MAMVLVVLNRFSRPASAHPHGVRYEILQQRLGLQEIGRVKALRRP
jgi:hypothetical protein